jgi:hypothetical protein
MFLKPSAVVLFLALGPVPAFSQAPIRLDAGDVYFQFRPASQKGAVGLCGFNIRGNHNSRANPRVEWDLNIDELMAGTTRVVGVSAGTFNVVGHDRKARAPIVELNFSVDGDPQPIPARMVGLPNADNAVKALLDEASANKLFTAFSEGRRVTISFKYADDTADVLQVEGWRFGSGKNSDFNQCLRGFTPSLRDGLRTIK